MVPLRPSPSLPYQPGPFWSLGVMPLFERKQFCRLHRRLRSLHGRTLRSRLSRTPRIDIPRSPRPSTPALRDGAAQSTMADLFVKMKVPSLTVYAWLGVPSFLLYWRENRSFRKKPVRTARPRLVGRNCRREQATKCEPGGS